MSTVEEKPTRSQDQTGEDTEKEALKADVVIDGDEKDKKEEEEEEEEKVPDLGGTKRLNAEFGRKYCCYTFFGFVCAFANGAAMPLFGVLFRELFEILAESIDPLTGATNFSENILVVLLGFIGMGVGMGVFTVLQYFFWGSYGVLVAVDVRSAWYAALLRQDIGYHDEKTSSKLNAILTTESAAIEAGVGMKMGVLWQQFASFFVGIVLAFFYSWRMTLVLLGLMPVLICIGVIQGLLFAGAGQNSDPFVNAGSFSQEVLTNIRTVAAFPDLITYKYKGYVSKVMEGLGIAIKRARITGFSLGFFMLGMIGIMYALGFYAGARFVDEGWVKQQDMFGAFFCFMVAGMGLGQLGSVVPDIQKSGTAANRFYAITARTPQMKEPDNGEEGMAPKSKLAGGIEFKNVSFAYASAPDTKVLDNVSFRVLPGQTVALVGPSGSGKSTAISLMERFYDPTEGEIVIDDQDKIHNYELSYLRSNIGLVSQMPLLFDTTIEENIRGGNKEASQQDIEDAAKAASAHEFILALPDGYQTSVGELGGRLSGGQRQRIAIARAMLSKPPILLLDEATSALDSNSEKEVQEAIDKIASTRNQTVIAIAHRLSTIQHSDNIVVLVDGKIREQGNHAELMAGKGVYAALVNAQALVEQKKATHIRRMSSTTLSLNQSSQP